LCQYLSLRYLKFHKSTISTACAYLSMPPKSRNRKCSLKDSKCGEGGAGTLRNVFKTKCRDDDFKMEVRNKSQRNIVNNLEYVKRGCKATNLLRKVCSLVRLESNYDYVGFRYISLISKLHFHMILLKLVCRIELLSGGRSVEVRFRYYGMEQH
jgi:hypothetical protein